VLSAMQPSGHDADAAATLTLAAALALLEETVGDRGFVAELIGDFLDALPGQLAALRAGESAGDGEELHRIAHTLKSNAATFGAEGLALACRRLEQAVRAGGAPENQELIELVEAEAARATPGLAAARHERYA
jgi:HPt (histidine-containing phosphotransfer) domain-containing protein